MPVRQEQAMADSLSSPILCTPPIPPVTKTGMPALWAHIMVADTVVPPLYPWEGSDHMMSCDPGDDVIAIPGSGRMVSLFVIL